MLWTDLFRFNDTEFVHIIFYFYDEWGPPFFVVHWATKMSRPALPSTQIGPGVSADGTTQLYNVILFLTMLMFSFLWKIKILYLLFLTISTILGMSFIFFCR